MTVIPAGTEVAFRITYLEMPKPRVCRAGMPDGVRLEHAVEPPVWFFLSMYDAVGATTNGATGSIRRRRTPRRWPAFVS
jgi:hypothetical protein